MGKRKGWFLLFLGMILVTGCALPAKPSSVDSQGKIQVVAAENFYGEVAQAVGGEQVQVTSILQGGVADPHGFEAKADEAKAVSKAQVILYNGLGYDHWMENLIVSTQREGRIEIAVARDVGGHQEGDNVHVWYDVNTMAKLADVLAGQFSRLDPAHQSSYHARAEAYKKKLQPLLDKMQTLRQATPLPVAETEPVFDYMSRALNLQPLNTRFALAVSNEVDPSPSDIRQIEEDLQAKRVRLLLYNEQEKNRDVDHLLQVANASGIPVVSVTEQEPAGKDYLAWMLDQLNELERAMHGR